MFFPSNQLTVHTPTVTQLSSAVWESDWFFNLCFFGSWKKCMPVSSVTEWVCHCDGPSASQPTNLPDWHLSCNSCIWCRAWKQLTSSELLYLVVFTLLFMWLCSQPLCARPQQGWIHYHEYLCEWLRLRLAQVKGSVLEDHYPCHTTLKPTRTALMLFRAVVFNQTSVHGFVSTLFKIVSSHWLIAVIILKPEGKAVILTIVVLNASQF